jgi:hypothetical protein
MRIGFMAEILQHCGLCEKSISLNFDEIFSKKFIFSIFDHKPCYTCYLLLYIISFDLSADDVVYFHDDDDDEFHPRSGKKHSHIYDNFIKNNKVKHTQHMP